MSAVAESSGPMRDESVRPASGVTRLQRPDAAQEGSDDRGSSPPPGNESDAARDGLQRFRW
jgi:hypothetical protein